MNFTFSGITYAIVLLWNLIVFTIYGIDKFLAKNNMYRISEKVLISSAFLLGGVGAYAGMRYFRHKTKHNTFKIAIPIASVITIFFLIVGDNILKMIVN